MWSWLKTNLLRLLFLVLLCCLWHHHWFDCLLEYSYLIHKYKCNLSIFSSQYVKVTRNTLWHINYTHCRAQYRQFVYRDKGPVQISLNALAIVSLMLMMQIVHDIFLMKEQKILKRHRILSKK